MYSSNYILEIEVDNGYLSPKMINGYKYYALEHNTDYKVKLINNSSARCNVELSIDGEMIGKFRLNAFSQGLIERPVKNNRKFVFVKENSYEANMGDVDVGASKNGLVEAKFIPELYNKYYEEDTLFCAGTECVSQSIKKSKGLSYTNSVNESQSRSFNADYVSPSKDYFSSYENISAGATVLGEKSNQNFNNASYMEEDLNNTTTKRVRLVVKEEKQWRPYVSLKSSGENPNNFCRCYIDGFEGTDCFVCGLKRKRQQNFNYYDPIPPRLGGTYDY